MKQSNKTSHENLKAWRTWCHMSQKSFMLNWLYGLFYQFIFNFVDIRSFFFQEHAMMGSEITPKSVTQAICVNIGFCRICCSDKSQTVCFLLFHIFYNHRLKSTQHSNSNQTHFWQGLSAGEQECTELEENGFALPVVITCVGGGGGKCTKEWKWCLQVFEDKSK